MNALLHHLNPAVPRRLLVLFAALTWGGVGTMLLIRSGIWLTELSLGAVIAAVAVGLLMAGLMIPGMFLRLVRKNLVRLSERPERACLFSAFAWRSWGIAAVMSVAGVTLRGSDIPRIYLAAPYLGMGLCLLAGAILYGQSLRAPAD